MGTVNTLLKPYKEEVALEPHISNMTRVLNQLQDEIISNFSELIADVESGHVSDHLLKSEIDKLVTRHRGWFDVDQVKTTLFNQLFGYGFLQALIEDDDITDIDVLRHDYVLIKKFGNWHEVDISFNTTEELLRYCKLIITRNGGMLNDADSHCRVSDSKYKLRINATIPPRNVLTPTLNIRKHRQGVLTLEDLLNLKMITQEDHLKLKEMNRLKKSILICGKGGAGKTTLLSGILSDVHKRERVLICESDIEIYPQRPNMISQTIKKSYLGGISRQLSDLINDGLTMSLDTYCVGEIIGEEAWDLIQAGLTDHRVLGTIHANGSRDVFFRLYGMMAKGIHLSESTLMEMICRSIDVIIYVNTFRIEEITYVKGYDRALKEPRLEF